MSDHLNSRGFSQVRLDRMHDVMAGYVERGEVPGIVTISRRGAVRLVFPFARRSCTPRTLRLFVLRSKTWLYRYGLQR